MVEKEKQFRFSPMAKYMRGKIKEHNLIGTGAFPGNMMSQQQIPRCIYYG